MNYDEEIWKRFETNSKVFIYSVSDFGRVMRTAKKSYKENVANLYVHKGVQCVKINRKEYRVKKLVLKIHSKDYQEGIGIIHKDGDLTNCKLTNLQMITKQELGALTGGLTKKSQKVICNGQIFSSERKCAKHLFCSYQALNDYLNGKVKNSVLSEHKIRRIKMK